MTGKEDDFFWKDNKFEKKNIKFGKMTESWQREESRKLKENGADWYRIEC